jgi:hypothetical protein
VTSPIPSDRGPLSATEGAPPKRGRPVLRILTWLLLGLLGVVAVAGGVIAAGWVYYHPAFEVEKGVVYGERNGEPLQFDVVSPARPNGLGIIY